MTSDSRIHLIFLPKELMPFSRSLFSHVSCFCLALRSPPLPVSRFTTAPILRRFSVKRGTIASCCLQTTKPAARRYPVIYYFHGHSDRYTVEKYDNGTDTIPKMVGVCFQA